MTAPSMRCILTLAVATELPLWTKWLEWYSEHEDAEPVRHRIFAQVFQKSSQASIGHIESSGSSVCDL